MTQNKNSQRLETVDNCDVDWRNTNAKVPSLWLYVSKICKIKFLIFNNVTCPDYFIRLDYSTEFYLSKTENKEKSENKWDVHLHSFLSFAGIDDSFANSITVIFQSGARRTLRKCNVNPQTSVSARQPDTANEMLDFLLCLYTSVYNWCLYISVQLMYTEFYYTLSFISTWFYGIKKFEIFFVKIRKFTSQIAFIES